MYIKYTFVHFSILLICQVLGAVLLPVTISLAVEALSFQFGSSFGLLQGSDNLLAGLLEVPFLSIAFFLELVVFLTINTCCSFLISTSTDFSIEKSSEIVFVIPCTL